VIATDVTLQEATMTDAPVWTRFSAEPSALGESPFWHPAEQALYWIDIEGRQVCRASGTAGRVEYWDLPENPGCMAPAAGGGLVIALRNAIYRAPHWQGALRCLQVFDHDPATTRFNDGKCDPRGRFWAGTMYEPRDLALARLYALDARAVPQGGALQVGLQADGGTIANGLAWSPDAQTLYWSDTSTHLVRAWDWDAQHNLLSNVRHFRQFEPKPAGWTFGAGMAAYGGRPDGASVDAEGNYWVAMFEGGRILKLSPQGALLAELPIPVLCPTMPCFGGDDLQTLYVTSARHKRSAVELSAFPDSGCVFSTRVDVPGLPVNFFLD
jgi:sugar lactone lactonase YvrE